jgi:hypothetical protein
MNSYQVALIAGAVFVALTSWRLERSMMWIVIGAASFLASAVWERYELPMPALFTACCDAVVCLSIYAFARQAWELMLYRIFLGSILISIVFLGFTIFPPKIAPHAIYISLLEAVNWLALLLIFGTAAMQRIKANGGASFRHGRRVVLRAQHALFSPARPHSWWHA